MKRVILGLLFMLIGGGVISWSSRTASRVSATKSWPTVRGTVLSSTVVADSSWAGGKYSVHYQPDVNYRFTVNAATYESNIFVLGAPKLFVDRAEAEKVVAAHPAGGGVTVYYEARNPARSGLEPAVIPQQLGLMTITSGMFLLIGLMLSISGALGWARSELVGR